jgi:hypothetical protein
MAQREVKLNGKQRGEREDIARHWGEEVTEPAHPPRSFLCVSLVHGPVAVLHHLSPVQVFLLAPAPIFSLHETRRSIPVGLQAFPVSLQSTSATVDPSLT